MEAFAATDAAETAAIEAGELGMRFVIVADNVRSWLLRGVGRIDEADELSSKAYEASSAGRLGDGRDELRGHARPDRGTVVAAETSTGLPQRYGAPNQSTSFHGTMAWHHRQRYGLQQARLVLLGGDLEQARAGRGDSRRRCRGTRLASLPRARQRVHRACVRGSRREARLRRSRRAARGARQLRRPRGVVRHGRVGSRHAARPVVARRGASGRCIDRVCGPRW